MNWSRLVLPTSSAPASSRRCTTSALTAACAKAGHAAVVAGPATSMLSLTAQAGQRPRCSVAAACPVGPTRRSRRGLRLQDRHRQQRLEQKRSCAPYKQHPICIQGEMHKTCELDAMIRLLHGARWPSRRNRVPGQALAVQTCRNPTTSSLRQHPLPQANPIRHLPILKVLKSEVPKRAALTQILHIASLALRRAPGPITVVAVIPFLLLSVVSHGWSARASRAARHGAIWPLVLPIASARPMPLGLMTGRLKIGNGDRSPYLGRPSTACFSTLLVLLRDGVLALALVPAVVAGSPGARCAAGWTLLQIGSAEAVPLLALSATLWGFWAALCAGVVRRRSPLFRLALPTVRGEVGLALGAGSGR